MFTTSITEPQKLVRMTTMARAMLEEARAAPCDAAGCERLKRVHDRVIAELASAVSVDLHEELLTLSARFDEIAPSPSEVRLAQAELVGWLEGVMAGIVAASNIGQRDTNSENNPQEHVCDTAPHGLYL